MAGDYSWSTDEKFVSIITVEDRRPCKYEDGFGTEGIVGNEAME